MVSLMAPLASCDIKHAIVPACQKVLYALKCYIYVTYANKLMNMRHLCQYVYILTQVSLTNPLQ